MCQCLRRSKLQAVLPSDIRRRSGIALYRLSYIISDREPIKQLMSQNHQTKFVIPISNQHFFSGGLQILQ